MKSYNIALRPIHYASVSGGKDSLYMLKVIAENPDKYPLDLIVHFELEIDYPWVKDVITEIEKIATKLNVRLVRIKPRESWYDLYEKLGFPNRRFRWCNGSYKLDCEKQLTEWIKQQNCRPVAYIGLCADETKRFKYAIGEIEEGQNVIYPLAEEGYNEDDILRWARVNPIFNDYYKVNERQGCMFCPMSSYNNLAWLLWKYPEKYLSLMSMCYDSENKYGSHIFQSNPKYDVAYVDNIVRTKYTAKLKQELEKWGIPYDNN